VTEAPRWRVVWTRNLYHGVDQEIVVAWDAEEALATAAEMYPERWRPRIALPIDATLPPDAFDRDLHSPS
jgi:hypothetical protein